MATTALSGYSDYNSHDGYDNYDGHNGHDGYNGYDGYNGSSVPATKTMTSANKFNINFIIIFIFYLKSYHLLFS